MDSSGMGPLSTTPIGNGIDQAIAHALIKSVLESAQSFF